MLSVHLPVMPLCVETLTGEAIRPLVPALARLRTIVFRDFPYCYDGADVSEREHLAEFAASPRAGIVVAWDGEEPVGASTCMPLVDEHEWITDPFRERGLDPARFFYFGESVLLPAYRGQGVGVVFFERREAHARAVSDCDYSCFCAVIRDPNDPRRPRDFVPLNAFWTRRGYTPYPDLCATLRWREVGHSEETTNRLSFWIKSLQGAPLP